MSKKIKIMKRLQYTTKEKHTFTSFKSYIHQSHTIIIKKYKKIKTNLFLPKNFTNDLYTKYLFYKHNDIYNNSMHL